MRANVSIEMMIAERNIKKFFSLNFGRDNFGAGIFKLEKYIKTLFFIRLAGM